MNKKIQILTVLLIMIMIFTIGCSSSYKNSDGYYNDIKWDSTISDVEQKLGSNITVSDDRTNILQVIENFEEIQGSQAWVMYYFENDKLCEITITPSILPSKSSLSDEELNRQINDIYRQKYGECSETNSIENIWETKNSKISISSTSYIRYQKIEE